MKDKVVALLAIPLVALAWWAGVRTGERNAPGAVLPPVQSRPGTPVASFDGQVITAEELKARIEEQKGFLRARYATPEGRRELLESIIRFELLAREAQHRGYDKDPEVLTNLKRNMVAAFVEREFEKPHREQPVSDSEIERYYSDHLSDYQRPERVRAGVIFLSAPESDAAGRQARRPDAEKVLAEAKGLAPRDLAGFAELARARTEDQGSKAAGGDLRFLSREDLVKRAGASVAEAAFALKEIGAVTDAAVETPEGFWVVKLLGRENPLELKVSDVRESIRSRILYERRSQAYQQFVAALEKKAGLEVKADALASMKIDTEVPALDPGTLPVAPAQRTGAPVLMPAPGSATQPPAP